MDELSIFLLSFVTSGLASAAVVWLARTWISERIKNAIKHEYDAKLETHKAQLKSESDVSVERLKAQLQIAASERNTRFTKTFEVIAETVAETYKRLLALNDAVSSYLSIFGFQGDPSKADRRKIVADKMFEFVDYYRPRRLFLPPATTQRIDDLRKKLHMTTLEFKYGVEEDGDTRRRRANPLAENDIDTWMKAHDFMSTEVPTILALLEEAFRRVLGTAEDEKKS